MAGEGERSEESTREGEGTDGVSSRGWDRGRELAGEFRDI